MNILKTFVLTISSILFLTTGLLAQKSKPVLVLAGLKVDDCIPFQERYRFPEFTIGTVYFKNGSNNEAKLNYNLIAKEMEYLQGKDTLAIANENDIQQIIISGIVFIVNKGYLELIYTGKLTVGEKQYFNLMDVKKKDPYGYMSTGASTNTYNSLHSNGQYYKLIVHEDRIFQKVVEYYLATPTSGFVLFNKKKVKQLYPHHKKAIEYYLKSNTVNFDSSKDLIRFAEYLGDL
ncbi:MAG: hypothetical protein WC780_01025 [Lentimicrobiaceae bacterium]|jgi:hypothetical protein